MGGKTTLLALQSNCCGLKVKRKPWKWPDKKHGGCWVRSHLQQCLLRKGGFPSSDNRNPDNGGSVLSGTCLVIHTSCLLFKLESHIRTPASPFTMWTPWIFPARPFVVYFSLELASWGLVAEPGLLGASRVQTFIPENLVTPSLAVCGRPCSSRLGSFIYSTCVYCLGTGVGLSGNKNKQK